MLPPKLGSLISGLDVHLEEKKERSELKQEILQMQEKMNDMGLDFEDIDLQLEDLLGDTNIDMPELEKPQKSEKGVAVDVDFNKIKLKHESENKFDSLTDDISKQTFNVFGTLTGVDGNEWE
jgi:hypothetical protein